MNISKKIDIILDNYSEEDFQSLPVLAKAVVIYFRDNSIDEDLFAQARRESDYYDQALPLISNPRLENLLAPSVLDKYKLFCLDNSLSFSSLESLSAVECLNHVKNFLNVSAIEGKYFFEKDYLEIDSQIEVLFKKFFKKEIVNEIDSDINDLCILGGSSFLEIEVSANNSTLFFMEVSTREIPLSFWKNPLQDLKKVKKEDFKKAVAYSALALSLSLTACAKAVYKAPTGGTTNPPIVNPGTPGVVNPADPSTLLEMTFANYRIGNQDQPTLYPIMKDSRLSFPSEITEFSFDGQSETVSISSLAVYSKDHNSLLCIYDWTGVRFAIRSECEVSLSEGDALYILGIPDNQSVSLTVKSE